MCDLRTRAECSINFEHKENQQKTTPRISAIVEDDSCCQPSASPGENTSYNADARGISATLHQATFPLPLGHRPSSSVLLSDGCAICLDELADGSDVSILPCYHIFHPECIDMWLSRENLCPLCKVNVEEGLQRESKHVMASRLGVACIERSKVEEQGVAGKWRSGWGRWWS